MDYNSKYTGEEVEVKLDAIDGKQDEISDLDTIRSNAEKGAEANRILSNTEFATAEQISGLADTLANVELDIYNLSNEVGTKQEYLVSGTNIKTINGQSLLGSGNINIEGGEGGGGSLPEGVIDEEGYLYSHGEKIDMRFTRSLLPVGTSIPAKANLNTKTYLKIGKYYCSKNDDAKTITNCPVNVAFSMEVFNPLGTNVDDEDTKEYTYRLRVLTEFNTGVQYIQHCNTSGTPGSWTYNSWYVTPRAKFTLNSKKNDGSAAVGSATQGVYLSSAGDITKMTYTLGKSVPSSAVFTDTKVTAVGNHYTPAEDEAEQLDAVEGEVVIGLKRDAAGHVVDVISSSKSVIAEIESLGVAVEDLQDSKADVSGYYPLMSVGELGDTEFSNEAEFDIRVTADGISVKEEVAEITSIKGNSVVSDGQIVNMNVEAIKSIGVNAWDEQWRVGAYVSSSGAYFAGSTNKLCNLNPIPVVPNTKYYVSSNDVNEVYYYDSDMTFIGTEYILNLNQFTTPLNAHYVNFNTVNLSNVVYNNDICINVYDSQLNGQYFPYSEIVEDLSIIRKYFPDGMRSAGSACDELRYNKQSNKLEKITRVGQRPYQSGDEDDASLLTDNSKTNYELDEPIVEKTEEDYSLVYQVRNSGTEQAISSGPSSPFRGTIQYNFKANDTIRRNLFDIIDLKKDVAALRDSIINALNTEV